MHITPHPSALSITPPITPPITPCAGLYRAKGVVWLRERRYARYVFHLSGRQRVECVTEGPWASLPSTQLVLIGSHPEVVESLKSHFLTLVAQV